ncbi:MAG TPA: hypothetical protein VGK05_06455, partial [Acidimicrobiia bacterium]
GSLFGLKFLPTQLLQILRPDALRLDGLFPWIRFPGPATVIGDVTFDTRSWASSIPATMPALTLLGLGGVVVIARRAGTALVRTPLLAAVIGGLGTFTIAFVANRYMSDLLPAIVLASLVGLHALLGVLARPQRPGWARIGAIAVVVLVAISLWVNFGFAITYQRALDPATDEQRTGFIGFQQDVDDRLPGGPRGSARAGDQLPKRGSLGDLFVLGDCGGLYWSNSVEWSALERGNGAGHYRLRVRFPDATGGQEPILGLGTGTGTEQNVLSVRYLPGSKARFVLDSPLVSRRLAGKTVRIDPGRAHVLDVVMDSRLGSVRVRLDDEDVVDLIAFLVPGTEATIGATADPANSARFSGTIQELPVRTPLCDFVRSRYRP